MSYVIRERQEVLIWATGLSDEELDRQTNLATFDTLFSAAEEMAQRGFSEEIIRERIKYEKHLREEAKILQNLCESRGIETLKGYRKDEHDYSDTIIKSLEEKYKRVDLFDMYDKLAESPETKHLVCSIGSIHYPAENATDDDILVAYDKVITKEYRDKVIKPLEEKYKDVDLLEMCRTLSKSESTLHLVDWFGDYALWEPALNATSDDILLAYDKLKSFAQPQNIEASRSVKENISRGLSRAMPGHVLVNAWRKNNYDDDRHLFVVLAQNSITSDYVVWTSWNEYTQSLNHGHYALNESDINEVLSEHLHSDSSKPVCPEYVHQPLRVSNVTSSIEDVDELETENSRTI